MRLLLAALLSTLAVPAAAQQAYQAPPRAVGGYAAQLSAGSQGGYAADLARRQAPQGDAVSSAPDRRRDCERREARSDGPITVGNVTIYPAGQGRAHRARRHGCGPHRPR